MQTTETTTSTPPSGGTGGRPNVTWRQGLLALSPLAVFLTLYLGVSVAVGDFYRMPLSIAFIAAGVWALLTMRRMPTSERIEIFSTGAANPGILYMIWIFILSGAFSALASGIGAVHATVAATTALLPSWALLPGLFVTACFISMSIGTSVGTIVALTPLAAQLATATGSDVAEMVAIVLGGSFFGDNLSFISDTTVAATRTQHVAMADKFRANLRIALPAAIVCLVAYTIIGITSGISAVPHVAAGTSWLLMLPYLIVIVAAACGINVLVVLTIGIAACVALAMGHGSMGLLEMCSTMGDGIKNMSDLIIVTLLAGGLLEVINHGGGIRYIISLLTRRISGARGAQGTIAALVALVNVCTANNTIAILTVGRVARSIASQFGIDPRRTASLLDTCSCITQAALPYGAQTLLAAGLAGVAPVAFLPHLYYPIALALAVLITIVIGGQRRAVNGRRK